MQQTDNIRSCRSGCRSQCYSSIVSVCGLACLAFGWAVLTKARTHCALHALIGELVL